MTEEINDLVSDSLHLVILMQRAFTDFLRLCDQSSGAKKVIGGDVMEKALFQLQEIETNLNNEYLLEFDLNQKVQDIIDIIFEDIGDVRKEIAYTNKYEDLFSGFDKRRIEKWLGELEENIGKIEDLAMRQSPVADSFYGERRHGGPLRLHEQDPRDPDEIGYDAIHPDMKGEEEFLSDVAYENTLPDDTNVKRDEQIRRKREEEDQKRRGGGGRKYEIDPNEDW